MILVSSPYMLKLYAQLKLHVENIVLVNQVDEIFNFKDELMLIDENMHDLIVESGFVYSNYKIFTSKKLPDERYIYKYQSIVEILEALAYKKRNISLVVNYDIEKNQFNKLLHLSKKQHMENPIIDLCFHEHSNLNLFRYESLGYFPVDIIESEILTIFSNITDYILPPKNVVIAFINRCLEKKPVMIFTDNIKNELDMELLKKATKVFIVSAKPEITINHIFYKELTQITQQVHLVGTSEFQRMILERSVL